MNRDRHRPWFDFDEASEEERSGWGWQEIALVVSVAVIVAIAGFVLTYR